MKCLKKTLAALLAAACLTAGIPGAFAADESPFSDVPADAPYASAVEYVREQGLMSGTSDTTFEPDGPLTRATLATVLYRKAAIDAVRQLSVDVGIPTKLEKLREEDLDFLAQSAADACAPGNPKPASVEDFKVLFRKIM